MYKVPTLNNTDLFSEILNYNFFFSFSAFEFLYLKLFFVK